MGASPAVSGNTPHHFAAQGGADFGAMLSQNDGSAAQRSRNRGINFFTSIIGHLPLPIAALPMSLGVLRK
jgi:hypothetical protein